MFGIDRLLDGIDRAVNGVLNVVDPRRRNDPVEILDNGDLDCGDPDCDDCGGTPATAAEVGPDADPDRFNQRDETYDEWLESCNASVAESELYGK